MCINWFLENWRCILIYRGKIVWEPNWKIFQISKLFGEKVKPISWDLDIKWRGEWKQLNTNRKGRKVWPAGIQERSFGSIYILFERSTLWLKFKWWL